MKYKELYEKQGQLYNDLFIKYDEVIDKLEDYETRIIPKFRLKQKVYAYNRVDKKIISFIIDEIRISMLGIFCVQFEDKDSFIIYNEQECFTTILEAESYGKKLESKKGTK